LTEKKKESVLLEEIIRYSDQSKLFSLADIEKVIENRNFDKAWELMASMEGPYF
jgi:hypothetical protein